MTPLISVADACKSLLLYSEKIDTEQWRLEALWSTNALTDNDIEFAKKTLKSVQEQYQKSLSTFPLDAMASCKHVENKLGNFERKLVTLEAHGKTVNHQLFKNSVVFLQSPTKVVPSPVAKAKLDQPPKIYKPLSFSITDLGKGSQKLSHLQILDRISYFFRHGKEAQALMEFAHLPSSIQKAAYEALSIVKGIPLAQAEVSFKNNCTPHEKGCAVELAKTKAILLEVIDAFEKKDSDLAYITFKSLPSKIKNEIFSEHWMKMGCPLDPHPMAHSDFGQVSFLGTEKRCDVPPEKKVVTILAYLPLFREKIDSLQLSIKNTQAEWVKIDQSLQGGYEKNERKKNWLHELANSFIVPDFVAVESVDKPTPKINKSTGSPGGSYHALAEAYIESYPCLRPFFLQLVPDLVLSNETLTEGQLPDVCKFSQAVPPNLSTLSDAGRKKYRTAIMMETLATLNDGYYVNSKGQKITLDLQPAAQSLYCLPGSGEIKKRDGNYKTQIFLDKKDCLTVTRECIERGLEPIVLDAASDAHFGGGYMEGAGAQEENLCRRTGLPVAVDPKQKRQTRDLYPISKLGAQAGLYVSNVPVFRGEEGEGYPYLDKPFETAVAIMAAYNFNEEHQKKHGMQNVKKLVADEKTGELRIPPAEAVEMKGKLRNVLHMAQANGHDSVVLIPLGCGAFCNPPKHVCEMMMELITEEFPNSFKEVHISVIDDHNTGKAHNPRGNYAEFKDTIEKNYLPKFDGIGAKFALT